MSRSPSSALRRLAVATGTPASPRLDHGDLDTPEGHRIPVGLPLVDKTMDGEIECDLLDNWATCRIRFNPHSYARRKARDAEAAFDHYFIQLYVRGSLHGECAGRGVYVRPGDILILDVRESSVLRTSSGEIITLIIPHAAIDRLPADLHGQVLRHELPSTRRLAAQFESLQTRLAELAGDGIEALQSTILDALRAAIDDTIGQSVEPRASGDLGEQPSGTRPEPAQRGATGRSDPAPLRAVHDTLLDWARRGD
ncbi:hypothetical protein [Guyparkeria halophila]|nr:hypothetical protein [Guyparkeria halophila]